MAGEERILCFPRTERHSTIMSHGFGAMKQKQTFVDVRLVSQDRVFPCHRLVISTYSPVLHAMLTLDTMEASRAEVRLDHIPPDILHIILDYMYGSGVRIGRDQLMGTIAACDFLQIPELKEMCLDEVPASLHLDNVIAWWKRAAMLELENITIRCEEMIAAELDNVSQQVDFLKLTLQEVLYCFCVCCETVTTISLFKAALRWVDHDDSNRITHVEELLEQVCLEDCPLSCLKAINNTYQKLLNRVPALQTLLSDIIVKKSTVRPVSSKPKLVIVGGQEEQKVSAQCWQVDESGSEEFCEIPNAQRTLKSSICTTPQGFAITGGLGSKSCLMFNSSTKSWLQLPDMPCARYGHGSIYANGAMLAIGGIEMGAFCNSTVSIVNSLATDFENWKEDSALPHAMKFPKVSEIDDQVYVLDSEDTNELLYLNNETNTWEQKEALPLDSPHVGLSMTAAGGKLYVAGGRCKIFASYSPATDSWCLGRPPLREHKYGALACHGDGKRLLLMGGSFHGSTGDVEEYDLEEDSWSVSSCTMPLKLYHHQAVILYV